MIVITNIKSLLHMIKLVILDNKNENVTMQHRNKNFIIRSGRLKGFGGSMIYTIDKRMLFLCEDSHTNFQPVYHLLISFYTKT